MLKQITLENYYHSGVLKSKIIGDRRHIAPLRLTKAVTGSVL